MLSFPKTPISGSSRLFFDEFYNTYMFELNLNGLISTKPKVLLNYYISTWDNRMISSLEIEIINIMWSTMIWEVIIFAIRTSLHSAMNKNNCTHYSKITPWYISFYKKKLNRNKKKLYFHLIQYFMKMLVWRWLDEK